MVPAKLRASQSSPFGAQQCSWMSHLQHRGVKMNKGMNSDITSFQSCWVEINCCCLINSLCVIFLVKLNQEEAVNADSKTGLMEHLHQ